MVYITGREAFFLVCTSSFQPRAVTIAMGGRGLSHERVEDGWQEYLCEAWRLKTLQNWGYGNSNACKG